MYFILLCDNMEANRPAKSEFTKEVQNMKKIRGLRSSGRAGTAAARAAPELVEPILE